MNMLPTMHTEKDGNEGGRTQIVSFVCLSSQIWMLHQHRNQRQTPWPTIMAVKNYNIQLSHSINTFRRQMLMNLIYSQTPNSCTVLWASHFLILWAIRALLQCFPKTITVSKLSGHSTSTGNISFACIPSLSCITDMKAFTYIFLLPTLFMLC